MRATCTRMVYELARTDDRVVFVGSDLSPGFLREMREEMPERWYMEGVSEANVIGMAAGLAMDGFMPYVNTIATFITRRCYEQVAIDLCLHDLPVRLIGNGGGLVYAPLGPTHLAIEDIVIMRALPNMAVVAVCDADEMVRLMRATLSWPHPIYIRLAKGGDPIISNSDAGFAIGKAIPMVRSNGRSDVVLVSTGVMTTTCLEAARELSSRGLSCSVVHAHTVKPLDAETVLDVCAGARGVVTVEEGVASGGLGSAVLEVLADELGAGIPPVKRLGLPDRFPEKYGSQQELLDYYGLAASDVVAAGVGLLALSEP
ncbi:MAG TPA: transketolase C-terminal domain-containing protein [Acidimicrobiales bacterium]|nr:transketolase C-terminal domain-containing protein [Acidimicrobiales bacterium]